MTSPPNKLDPAQPSALAALFAQHGFRPKKRLGQNFLISPAVADHIVAVAQLSSEDNVLEIGAGAGALTLRLAQLAGEVVAVELDREVLPILAEVIAPYSVRVLPEDVLKIDLGALLGEGRWKVLGNLPYYITGPILGKLMERRQQVALLVAMMQKEVADRIASPPGSKEYGSLSVIAQAFFVVRREMVVKRANFYPKPEVDSAVVSLTPRSQAAVPAAQEARFTQLVKAAFAHRRKTLENSLVDAQFVTSRAQAVEALERAEIGAGRRAESLSVAEFATLVGQLNEDDNH